MNAAKAISEKNKGQIPTGCLIVFGSIFLLAGLVALWFSCLRPTWRSYQAQSWPATQATITHSRVEVSRDDEGTSYKPEIHFTFLADGQLQESETWSFSVWSGDRNWAQGVVNRYPVESKHECYYNPRRPTDAVLERQFQSRNLRGLFTLIFVAAGGGLLWFAIRAKTSSKSTTVSGESGGALPDRSKVRLLTGGTSAGERCEPPWQALEGPQRLKPAVSKMARFVGISLFAVFWNAISWFLFMTLLQGNGWLSFAGIFLTIFVIAGAGLAFAAGYLFLTLFNPVISVALSNGAVAVGDTVDIAWETQGRASRIAELIVDLVGQEQATYTRGTSTYTDEKEFLRIQVIRTSDPEEIQFGSDSRQIPARTMHSFAAANNKIEWTVRVQGVIHWWPDVKESMPFAVKPAAADKTQRDVQA